MSFNWGIIGTGWIATEMADALLAVNHEIYGVSSFSLSDAQAYASRYGVQHVFETTAALLADPHVDIVYIATPHHIHYDLIKQALLAGKHVFCEKAITVNRHQLKEVLDLALAKKLVVMEGLTIFHMPIFKYLKESVSAGVIGKVKMIQVNFGSHKAFDPNNRFFNPDLAGGALLDIGGYATSFARLFMDTQPDRILTTVNYFETGVDEQSSIIYQNASGQMASITLTMLAKQPKRGLIAGDKGYIEVYQYPRGDRATITDTETGETKEIMLGDSAKALQYEVIDMEEFVTNQDVLGGLGYSLEVMTLLDAVRQEWGFVYPFEKDN